MTGHRRWTAAPRRRRTFRAGPDEGGAPVRASWADLAQLAAFMLLLAAPDAVPVATATPGDPRPGAACVTRMTPTDPPRFLQSGPGCGRD